MSVNDADPLVGILMGSDSDWGTMRATAETLTEFGVAREARVLSAHRTPAETTEYASTAEDRGLRVVIAAAGGAAHLAGVVAAHTTLPVIGVPMQAWALDGLDSLLSTVQMPRGIPVATVGDRQGGRRQCRAAGHRDPGAGRPRAAPETARLPRRPVPPNSRHRARLAVRPRNEPGKHPARSRPDPQHFGARLTLSRQNECASHGIDRPACVVSSAAAIASHIRADTPGGESDDSSRVDVDRPLGRT